MIFRNDILAMLIFVMAIISGISRTQLKWMVATTLLACIAVCAKWPEKLARFQPLFNPMNKLDSTGYQIGQSLWAIIRGGIWGVGPGHSTVMYSLPDHTTDFIFLDFVRAVRRDRRRGGYYSVRDFRMVRVQARAQAGR